MLTRDEARRIAANVANSRNCCGSDPARIRTDRATPFPPGFVAAPAGMPPVRNAAAFGPPAAEV
jgi:hypothetical protein